MSYLSRTYDVPKGLNLEDSSLVVYDVVCFDIIGEHTRAGYSPVASPPPFKKQKHLNTMISTVKRNSHFNPNHSLKSADDWYIGIL